MLYKGRKMIKLYISTKKYTKKNRSVPLHGPGVPVGKKKDELVWRIISEKVGCIGVMVAYFGDWLFVLRVHAVVAV